jgi:hypothetical protein
LRIQYGDRHAFHYSDRPEGGVQIEISIPYIEPGAGVGATSSTREHRMAKDQIDRNSGANVSSIGYT